MTGESDRLVEQVTDDEGEFCCHENPEIRNSRQFIANTVSTIYTDEDPKHLNLIITQCWFIWFLPLGSDLCSIQILYPYPVEDPTNPKSFISFVRICPRPNPTHPSLLYFDPGEKKKTIVEIQWIQDNNKPFETEMAT